MGKNEVNLKNQKVFFSSLRDFSCTKSLKMLCWKRDDSDGNKKSSFANCVFTRRVAREMKLRRSMVISQVSKSASGIWRSLNFEHCRDGYRGFQPLFSRQKGYERVVSGQLLLYFRILGDGRPNGSITSGFKYLILPSSP